jgi:hypothetical protein
MVVVDFLAATFEHYTLVGLLRESIDTYEATAMQAWFELEATIAGKRRKFLTWSHGAQELLARAGHGGRDKSDEEFAEEDDLVLHQATLGR